MAKLNSTPPDGRYNPKGTPPPLPVYLDLETDVRRATRWDAAAPADAVETTTYEEWLCRETDALHEERDTLLDYYGVSPRHNWRPLSSARGFRRALDIYSRSRCVNKGKETDHAHWRCERNLCEDCVELNVFSIGSAILWSRPWCFFTVNYTPFPWAITQDWMDRFKQWLQRTLRNRLGQRIVVSWLWGVERYPSGKGVHVHGYIHRIPGITPPELKLLMDDYTTSHKAQDTYVRPVEQAPEATATYIMKALKLSERHLIVAQVREEIEDYFHLNGKDIVHATNGPDGFVRDETGRHIGLDDARPLAIERYRQWKCQPAA